MDTVPDMWHVSVTCQHVSVTCTFLTLLPDELQGSVRGQIGVEFRQEYNGHGPRHVARVCHVSTRVNTCQQVSVTCTFLTLLLDELQGSVRGQIWVEFRQEYNGHGPRHVASVCHVSTHVNTCLSHVHF